MAQTVQQVYEQLTAVDLDKEREVWDERGRGYYGEFLVFNVLFDRLSDDSKILMNVEIPTGTGDKTTEIDMLLIHKYGLYCFEMKHYKGDIFCNFNQDRWVQAFRTTKNYAFNSPLRQNEYHIAALKKMFPNVPVHSVVVFTNEMVRLHDGGNGCFDSKTIDNATVCTLEWLNENMFALFAGQKKALTMASINEIFIALEPYSKIQGEFDDGYETLSFSEYLNRFHPIFQRKIKTLEAETTANITSAVKRYETKTKKARASIIISTFVAIASVIGLFVGNTVLPAAKIKKVEDKYQDFFQRYEVVNNQSIVDDINADELVDIKDIKAHKTAGDGLNITFDIVGLRKDYGIVLNGNSRLIIHKTDGTVLEVDIFSDHNEEGMILRNSAWLQRAYEGSNIHIKTVEIPSIESNEIKYMKLINTSLFKTSDSNTTLKNNVEIEVFK